MKNLRPLLFNFLLGPLFCLSQKLQKRGKSYSFNLRQKLFFLYKKSKKQILTLEPIRANGLYLWYWNFIPFTILNPQKPEPRTAYLSNDPFLTQSLESPKRFFHAPPLRPSFGRLHASTPNGSRPRGKRRAADRPARQHPRRAHAAPRLDRNLRPTRHAR